MHSARTDVKTNSKMKSRSNISDAWPRFGSTKLAAGAPPIRAFCECVGVCAIRGVLMLAVLSALLIAARPAQAQTETVLYNFCSQPNCIDGAGPASSLTSDGKGNFYGTTTGFSYSGSGAGGTVFELSPNGSGGWNETVLYSFCSAPNCTDGWNPNYSTVIFDSKGNLYGTTAGGGANGTGVVFELSPVGTSWTETVLYSFAAFKHGYDWDGETPESGVIMDRAGNLYGTTYIGGRYSDGTVFELSPSGGSWTEKLIFLDTITNYAGLTMDAAGNLCGIGVESVFELSPNRDGGWTSNVIHTFTGSPEDGFNPEGTPVLDKAGNLYGTTTFGGAYGSSNHGGSGTVYKLSRGKKGTWTEKILYSFKGTKGGSRPWAGVVLDAAGNIYATTKYGGEYGWGNVFELAPIGKGSYTEKLLWSFNWTDGANPTGSLIMDNAGNLYGTTDEGGLYGAGVVFEITP